jgi:hypothetical protein
MATNPQGTRSTTRTGDTTVADTTTATPVGTTGTVGNVAVYDNDGDRTTNPSLHTSTTRMDDRVPVETRSGGSILSWIIGAIVLIVLAYFLFQILF